MFEASLIVPAYNIAPFLGKSLESLAQQTLDSLEVIVIDDGSTDGTGQIIDEFAARYPGRIRKVRTTGGGPGGARNAGLAQARGAYVGFVDGDDFVDVAMCARMVAAAHSSGADLVTCQFERVYADRVELSHDCGLPHHIDTAAGLRAALALLPHGVWGKLWRREVIGTELFSPRLRYQDLGFFLRVFPNVTSVVRLDDPFYKYVQRDGSITDKGDRRVFELLEVMNLTVLNYAERGMLADYWQELEFRYVKAAFFWFVRYAAKLDRTGFADAVSEAWRDVHELYPQFRRNKYLGADPLGIYLRTFTPASAWALRSMVRTLSGDSRSGSASGVASNSALFKRLVTA